MCVCGVVWCGAVWSSGKCPVVWGEHASAVSSPPTTTTNNNASPYAHRVWWALKEKGMGEEDYDYIHIELGKNKPTWYQSKCPLCESVWLGGIRPTTDQPLNRFFCGMGGGV
jgi:hypothetical protein